jgi:hypothetical protein
MKGTECEREEVTASDPQVPPSTSRDRWDRNVVNCQSDNVLKKEAVESPLPDAALRWIRDLKLQ